MIRLERILRLRNVPLFADLSVHELGRMATRASEITCLAGTALFEAGAPGECLYVVLDGTIRIHHADRELRVIGPQGYLGEMSVIESAPRSASATALTDALLLRIDRTDFLRLLEEHPSAALTVLQTLSRRLREST